MPSQYPRATNAYDPTQVNQLVRTLINDLTRLEQPAGLGYSVGSFPKNKGLLNNGLSATGSVGTVSVSCLSPGNVSVEVGISSTANNVNQVLGALIEDLKARGLLG